MAGERLQAQSQGQADYAVNLGRENVSPPAHRLVAQRRVQQHAAGVHHGSVRRRAHAAIEGRQLGPNCDIAAHDVDGNGGWQGGQPL